MALVEESKGFCFKSRETNLDSFPINYDFFLTYSSELFYFLGFVAGDGNVGDKAIVYSKANNKNYISVRSCSDSYIIYKFRDLFAPNHKVSKSSPYVNKQGKSCWEYSLQITRQKLWSIISSYDVKSPSVFSRIPRCYLPDFLRGFLDSDGEIVVLKNQNPYGIEVKFNQANAAYMRVLHDLLVSLGFQCSKVAIEKNGNVLVMLSTVSSLKLLKMMYINKGDLYLRRKYTVYESVLLSRGGRSVKEINQDVMKDRWTDSIYRENFLKARQAKLKDKSVYAAALKKSWIIRRENAKKKELVSV